jgi:hypothetical protein
MPLVEVRERVLAEEETSWSPFAGPASSAVRVSNV